MMRRSVGGVVAGLVLAGCGAEPGDPAGGAAGDGATRFATAASPAVEAAPACGGSFAHDAHVQLGLTCEACHPCGGTYGFSPVTLPDGLSTVGGTMQNVPGTDGHSAGGTTCTVSCHGEPGVSAGTVTWSHGPLACTDCHQTIGGEVANARSTHAPAATDPVEGRAECETCHVMATHRSGVVRLATADGAPVILPQEREAFCKSCHDGAGKAIDGAGAPVLLGWVAGGADPHGTAGALPALGCDACHATHGSTNAFLFAPAVAGVPLAPSSIDRGGAGAEALCASCHPQQPRHAASGCTIECHSHGGTLVGHWDAPPVATTFSCFYCHGHEGIEHFQPPTGCKHCHGNSGWRPSSHPPEARPPRIAGLAVTPAATSATVSWSTDEFADTWVAYGTEGTRAMAGSGADATSHSVSLAALSPGVLYEARARSTDAYHNTAIGPAVWFTAGGPRVPALVKRASVTSTLGTVAVDLSWATSSDPSGSVQYRVELATTPRFIEPILLPWTTGGTARATLANGATYHWRVRARNALGYDAVSARDAFRISTSTGDGCADCHAPQP